MKELQELVRGKIKTVSTGFNPRVVRANKTLYSVKYLCTVKDFETLVLSMTE